MGVKGLIRLLADHGCIEDTAAATDPTALWRLVDIDDDNDHEDDDESNNRNSEGANSGRISNNSIPFPKDATLHIDGNGLAFFLLNVTYARHVQNVVGKKTTKKRKNKPLTPSQQRVLLPSFLPATLLTAVVAEFRKQLPPDATILFYWDGSLRRSCKEDRSDKIEQEWEQLHEYCTHGDFPTNSIACDTLFRSFPKNRLLLIDHIRYLFSNDRIRHIVCEEEADPCMAERARGNVNQYILGLDSDFILYDDINYIPLDRMSLIVDGDGESTDENSQQQLRVEVWRRNVLAQRLGLHDESMLVELAILLGNDYISSPSTQLQPSVPTKRKDILKYLKSQGAGFRAVGTTEDDEQRIQFVRSLYNHDDVSMFPLVEGRRENAKSSIRSQAPVDFPVNELRLQAKDKCARDAVLRVLLHCCSTKLKNDDVVVTSEHMDAFQAMGNKKKRRGVDLSRGKWRPAFADVIAASVISKAVSQCYSINAGSNKLKQVSPVQVFDESVFHALLWQLRKQNENQKDRTAATSSNLVVPTTRDPDSNPKVDEATHSELPIDKHKDEILEHILNNRITIIQGETGCGKSTRIPCMVLRAPAPNPMVPRVRIFMSQPRRLAAKALVERIRKTEPDLKDKVALRMGHGVKEYESKNSAAFFTTTGYLVRFIAGNFEALDNVTHLIIDEVHERSVDTDILCLMCRRLLQYNPVIRLVLMSATLAADLYREYFKLETPSLKVGARRFPVKEVYLDDVSETLAVSPADKRLIDKLTQDCDRLNASTTPNTFFMENMNKLVTKVTRLVAVPGRAILVFVPGMNDILALSESFDQMAEIPNVELNCYPIHSDVPFEDQMKIFDSLGPNEVRVFLATNSAESSITLPDVDNVICLGLCKQIVYNEASHRQMLLPTWISQASATQRSGRTGRVRPGTVYRMYTKNVYTRFTPFEPGEMVRIPLDSVILMLKDNMIKDDPVTETLLECLEPPDVTNIERSFESLFKSSFITEATDMCQVTVLGKFVSSLGIDLALGAVLGLGIQFGVGAEAIQMVACLSFPQSPWKLPNAMMQETPDFNNLAVGSFTSKCHFDGSLFSDPFAMMNLVWEYDRSKTRASWCAKHSIHEGRVRRLLLTCNNLQKRVAEHCGVRSDDFQMSQAPQQMLRAKATILRIIQVWVFHETIIQCKRSNFVKGLTEQSFSVELGEDGDRVTQSDLQQILSLKRHKFQLRFYNEISQKSSFTLVKTGFPEFVANIDHRLTSLFFSKEFDIAWVHEGSLLLILVRGDVFNNRDVFDGTLRKDLFKKLENRVLLAMRPVVNKRGVGERPCGQWIYEKVELDLSEHAALESNHVCLLYGSPAKGDLHGLVSKCKQFVRSSQHNAKGLGCALKEGKGNSKPKHKFNFLLCGDVRPLTPTDIQDLLSTPNVGEVTTGTNEGNQTILFPRVDNLPEGSTTKLATVSASGPLFNCVPEGARLLAVVASGRRRDHCIRLPKRNDSGAPGKKEDHNDSESSDDLVITFNRRQSDLRRRWQRFNSDSTVYTPDTSVVASALPIEGPDLVYCCCANTLEVRGGGLRAEGLTLLPPGRLFLLLCRLSFGLVSDNGDRKGLIKNCLQWVTNSDLKDGTQRTAKETKRVLDDWTQRSNQALDFHESCDSMGESLQCHPDKIKELLRIFDGIGGIQLKPWDIAADATLHGRYKRR